MNADELLNTNFDTNPEQEYRRGYLDGFLAVLEYADDGNDLEWLRRFHEQVLWSWLKTGTDDLIPPPLPEEYSETDKGFIRL
ncbi:MAG: hypothetical protein DCC55_15490 [Chloroflexi bacterium]|nr:MAG: hypothetical protein DCC55_15490 [Chloroflexota bacterium]